MHVSQSVLWNVPSQIAAHGNVLIAQTTEVWHGHVFCLYSSPSRGRVSSLKYALAHKKCLRGGEVELCYGQVTPKSVKTKKKTVPKLN